ncbi:hypothetical protein RD055328_11120 [Companilactobacillus sp. RD055328]|uniref:hypothetical protein n=1 Tax=Companilactobacillus sp. RD055328 TaxID=2916634 RepID=UPI001FC8561E|nr:hypothetical protein [Companilactobacillus sp. RD055328]GKQ43189.1 hypothetical protein RD055328_11120 [Companilactobacillus sp. RD055328]
MIFGSIIILIGLSFIIWTLFTQEVLSMKWIVYLTLAFFIMTIGTALLNVLAGYKVVMVVLSMLMFFFIVMKLRINIIYQVAINVLMVFIAVALIALINNI